MLLDFKVLKTYEPLKLYMLILAFVGLNKVFYAPDFQSAIMFWVLGVLICFMYLMHEYDDKAKFKNISKTCAYLFLGAAVASSFFFEEDSIPTIILLLSIVLYFGSLNIFFYALAPIILWFYIVPNSEFAEQFLSLPIRIFSSVISAKILYFCGFPISSDMTVIFIKDIPLAITRACSGIEQLEVMLILGLLFVMYFHKSVLAQILHYSFIVPSVIFANIVRLIISILLIYYFGEDVISDEIHFWLGIFMIVLSCAIMLSILPLFPKEEK